MIAHFGYLVGCSVRNTLRRHARRMRTPRYAIAAAIGLLYFFSIFGGWLPADEAGEHLGGVWLDLAGRVGPLLIALLSARWWLLHSPQHGIRLTPAETHLLVPAPVTRAQLIRFKILQVQPAILLSALIATFLTRGTDLIWPLRVLSIWALLATLHQHQIAASLVHTSAQQHGRSGVRAHLVPLVLFGAAFGTLVWRLLAAITDMRGNPSLDFIGARLLALLDEPAVRIVLAPFRFLFAPTLAESPAEWLPAFGGALLVLGAHYLWVVHSDAAFEEAAVARGERIARLAEAATTGGMSRLQLMRRDRRRQLPRPWLPLGATGRKAYAIFWKNVLYVQRSFRPTVVLPAAAIFFVVALFASADAGSALRVFALLFLGAAAMASLFGPLSIRNDLRTDLGHIDLLRTFPIAGRSLVAAGIAAAAVCISIGQIALLWVGLALLTLAGDVTVANALLFGAGGLIALPVVNALAVLIQNALALLYPSWVRIGTSGGGVEMMGQTVVIMVGSIIMLALLSIAPLVAGAIVGGPLVMVFGQAGLIIGAAAALAAAAAEVALLTLWLGRLYDRTDPVAAGLLR